jgi:hypothetical protein
MNRKLVILFLITTGFFLNACQKNIDIFVPDAGQISGPDTSWYSTITAAMPVTDLNNNLAIDSYKDSIQVSSNTSYITMPSGLQCYFPANCCVSNSGQVITGKVNVELMQIKNKGDMVRLGKPTTSYGRLLVSGNELFVRLKNDSSELLLAPGVKIQLRYSDPPISTQMKFFVGDESNTQQFNWLPNPDLINNTLSVTPSYYEIQTNHLHWVGSGYFFDTTGTSRVTIKADLAAYFTNANTVAYTVFKDFRSVVGMYGDISSKKFSTGKLPVGKAITVVVISKQGNDYFLGYQNTTTAAPTSGSEQSIPITPIKTSLSDIKAFLNTL